MAKSLFPPIPKGDPPVFAASATDKLNRNFIALPYCIYYVKRVKLTVKFSKPDGQHYRRTWAAA